jgi:hypothetical protein
MLTSKFGEKYLENPDISVGVKESAKRSVTVDGAVKSAGAYGAVGDLTLMQAIALAGGVTEDSNPRRIAVFRTIGGQRQAAAFDLVSIRRGEVADRKSTRRHHPSSTGNSREGSLQQIVQGSVPDSVDLPPLSRARNIVTHLGKEQVLNRDIALRDDRGWQVGPHLGRAMLRRGSATSGEHDRFRAIPAHPSRVAMADSGRDGPGLILAVLATLLTTPLTGRESRSRSIRLALRSWRSQQGRRLRRHPLGLRRTQVGLLKSTSVAQRVAEDLNLATMRPSPISRPTRLSGSGRPRRRCRQASA